jgi:lysophospholipase L1-like esterase
MSATHGSASRGRLLVGVLAVVFALSALFASTASAKGAPVKERYLALGDSLAFGYSQQLFNENEKLGVPATAFEHGYANFYMNKLKWKLNGIELVNNGCPGETSGGLIGTGPVGVGLSKGGAEPETPCEYHNVSKLPLHHEYGGTKSQLESAIEVIAKAAGEGKPVTTVSLNIGANDELHAVKKCEEEAKPTAEAAYIKAYKETLEKGGTPAEADANGKAAAKKAGKEFVENCLKEKAKALFTHIAKNTGSILYAIRKGAEFGGVNYGGKIVLLGGYDPYGNVFGEGELLPNSLALTAVLNGVFEKEVAPPFAACFANPLSRFNPGNKNEPAKLQAYTNMANFTKFEGKNNGPDIHPTPLGYKVIAAVMAKQCP